MPLLPMVGCSLQPQDPIPHPRETESATVTSSITRFGTRPSGLPTKEETEDRAISTSPVQVE